MHTCEYDPLTGYITWDEDGQRDWVGKTMREFGRFCCWAAMNNVAVRTKK